MKKIYQKLVRDKMPQIYQADLEQGLISDYQIATLSTAEIIKLLPDKLQEELDEVIAALKTGDRDNLQTELADLLEVIAAVAFHFDLDLSTIEEVQTAKGQKRGGFREGVFLESIDFID